MCIDYQLFHVLRLYSQCLGITGIHSDIVMHPRQSPLVTIITGSPDSQVHVRLHPPHHLPATGLATLPRRSQQTFDLLIQKSFATHAQCLALRNSWRASGPTTTNCALTHMLWYTWTNVEKQSILTLGKQAVNSITCNAP